MQRDDLADHNPMIATIMDCSSLAPDARQRAGDTRCIAGFIPFDEHGFRFGVIAGEMLPIGHILPSVGFLSEKIHLFIATDLERTEATPEWDEEIEIIEMPVEEIRDRLKTDYFVDAKTIAGLHRLLHHIDSRK